MMIWLKVGAALAAVLAAVGAWLLVAALMQDVL
jgi:hypothetical protein